MRHGCKINHLSRTAAHRSSMLSNMAVSLIKEKRIETTLAKAKALRKYVEPIINKSKEDSTHQRRIVFAYLRDKDAVTELFREVSQKVANRNGGYTRILKIGRRLGDGAEMAMMELVDYNENMLKETTTKKAKSTRRGGRKKAVVTEEVVKEETAATVATEEAVVEETPKTEE